MEYFLSSDKYFPRAVIGGIAGLLLFFLMSTSAQAATYYWAGVGAADRWEDADSWATVPKATGGAGIPGASDTAVLFSSGTTVRIRSVVSIKELVMTNVWTGSLLQGTGTLTVGVDGVKMGSGKLIGGNAAVTVVGNFTQTGGYVTGLQNVTTISGSLSITKGGTTTTPQFTSTGTITLNGNIDQTFTRSNLANTFFKNLTINNAGGGTSDDIHVNSSGGLCLSGALTITLGNLDLTTKSMPLFVERGIELANAAQATLTTNSNVAASGTILVGNAAGFTITGGTWTLNDDGDQSVDFDEQSLYNLTVNNTGGGTNDDVTIDGTKLNISGALTITLGNLNLTSNSIPMAVERGITLVSAAQATLTANSNISASGTILVGDNAVLAVTAGTLTLNDDGDQAVDFDDQSLYNLTVNNTGGGTNDDITVAGSSLNLSGALTITLGNLDVATNSLPLFVDGNMTIADAAQATAALGNVTVGGNFTINRSATFTHAGTLTLDGGSQTMSGSFVINKLTKNVTAAYTLTIYPTDGIFITNDLILRGTAGNLLSLRSGITGTRFKILPTNGPRTTSYLDVKDADNAQVTPLVCTTGCVDSGNNLNWTFTVASTTTTTTTTGTSSGGGGGRRSASTATKLASTPAAPKVAAPVVSAPVGGPSSLRSRVAARKAARQAALDRAAARRAARMQKRGLR